MLFIIEFIMFELLTLTLIKSTVTHHKKTIMCMFLFSYHTHSKTICVTENLKKNVQLQYKNPYFNS